MKKPIKKSQELLKTITTKDIKPDPRWHHILKNDIFWGLFFVSAIFGSIAFSIILYAVLESDFSTLAESLNSRIKFFMASLPFLWIIFLILFSIISIFGIKHTKTGYRYTAPLVITTNVLISILLGLLFFYSGGAQKIDNIFAKKLSSYTSIEDRMILRWSKPENGFLAGIILEKQNDDAILLEDFSGEKWDINIQNAVLHPKLFLKPEERIKIIGRMMHKKAFIAREIRPWKGRRVHHEEP